MKNPMRSIMWHSLFAISLILLGFIIAIIQSNQNTGQNTVASGMMMLLGFIWFVINRLRLWWYRKQLRSQANE